MNTTEQFENGMSIVQLEERYEMAASGEKAKNEVIFDPAKYERTIML